MTEQETREKIFNIVREFNVQKRRYSTHTEPSDDDELADALIAAGVVDKSDYASMKETAVRYKAEVSKSESRAKNAEHRAARAERALHCLARSFVEAMCKDGDDTHYLVDGFIQDAYSQAEKELAEEEKE